MSSSVQRASDTSTSHAHSPERILPDDLIAKLRRHNTRIGTFVQRQFQRFLLIVVMGPFVWITLRLLFRVRVVGFENIAVMRGNGIYAVRHFFEWDPLLTFYASLWPSSLRYPQYVCLSMASTLWTRTPVRRLVSWALGIMSFIPHKEPEQGALGRSVQVLSKEPSTSVAIYPTGPIGRKKEYHIRYGLGYIGARLADTPILPVTLIGVQELRLRDVLCLRRPRITIVYGKAFYGREVAVDGGNVNREAAICARVMQDWVEMESREAKEGK